MSDRWVVLKFGGTSVARPERWDLIVRRARELAADHRVWLVVSALSQVSNRLEGAIEEALRDTDSESLEWIRDVHERLAKEVDLDASAFAPVRELLEDLDRLLAGIRLTREASPRLRARVMSFGEMASTRLGVAIMTAAGLPACWVDAREVLQTDPRPREQEATRYLDADVRPVRHPERAESLVGDARVVITQGFIARSPRGETALLGRGGSDTSAALFACLLDAERLEIWTDVHGMFSADPRHVPSARLIRSIGYREAQELAAMGAKVLHPRCLGPVAHAGIPLLIRNTQDPEVEGTRIAALDDDAPAVMAVVCRRGVTLLNIETLAMWEESGFLARVFTPFDELGISVDLVATSQSAVSVTLDKIPGGPDGEPFTELLGRLERLGRVKVVHPCAVVSVVGRRIRTVLHELGPAMTVFREHDVYMVSESAEDLNLSFVVDENDANRLVESLHARLFTLRVPAEAGSRFGPTWETLSGAEPAGPVEHTTEQRWWRDARDALLDLIDDDQPLYVYHLPSVAARARSLRAVLGSVGRFYYSMKANPHPRILETVAAEGFGIECVSAAEIARAREVLGKSPAVLFTPNFCPPQEYATAFDAGAEVTIDGPQLLDQAPELFRGREIGLRVDPGSGLGHHQKVRTAGAHAKFGHPIGDAAEVAEAAARVGATVVGLHAHVGSGIRDPRVWSKTGAELASVRETFPDLRWLDLGGGLGIVERPGQEPLDLEQLETGLAKLRLSCGLELRIEPGRYLVGEAGVLLAPVTQVRNKSGVRFVGLATGMNSLIRPSLYGAWHGIHNLSRLDEPVAGSWHVVGPICETGDVLGRDRLLPETIPGDVFLIENCGAYGAVMSSRYNLRSPAGEYILE